jgi:hypothetical protein
MDEIQFSKEALQGLLGKPVIPSVHVPDFKVVNRSFLEKWFTLPWRPWVSTKSVYAPVAYELENGTVIVSPRTYAAILSHKATKHKN